MSKPSIPWLRVLAEFVAIFAGVSLSLVADDWRQDREDRTRELQMLAEVAEDLAQDSVELASSLRSMRSWDVASLWANRSAERTSVPPDSILIVIRGFGLLSFYQPVTSGYTGLKASGLLPLIRDESLRRDIIDYFEVQQPLIQQLFEVSQEGWDRWHRQAGRYVDWTAPPEGESMWTSLRHGNPLKTWPELMQDLDFRSHVDWAGLIGGNSAARLLPLMEINGQLRGRILEYIGRQDVL